MHGFLQEHRGQEKLWQLCVLSRNYQKSGEKRQERDYELLLWTRNRIGVPWHVLWEPERFNFLFYGKPNFNPIHINP